MKPTSPERIVIIGGGFSGLMTAVNLARLARRPLRLSIINHRHPLGRGVAYGTHRAEHLLNVPARNMSAFPDLPDHFLQWLRTRSEFDLTPERDLREGFIPRMIYGDYLRSLMQHYLQDGGPGSVHAEFVDEEASDIVPTLFGALVRLRGGWEIAADRVVLATGSEASANPPGAESVQNHPAWVEDPWTAWNEKPTSLEGTAVLLGAGLTAADAIITLRNLGWRGTIHAVSRHGWLPHAHFRGIEYPAFPPAGVDLTALGLQGLLSLMEEHCAHLREAGANPAIIVDKMRPHTQQIWRALPIEEQRIFLSQHASRWNVLRHRISPDIHAQLAGMELTGQLRVHAAGIRRIEASGPRLRILLDGGTPLESDLVINATGPHLRFSQTRSPLLKNLLDRGLIAADGLDIGLLAAPDHTVIDGDGNRSPHLLALGPLLRGVLWESTAVPELRIQARSVAETVLDQEPHREKGPTPLVEYEI